MDTEIETSEAEWRTLCLRIFEFIVRRWEKHGLSLRLDAAHYILRDDAQLDVPKEEILRVGYALQDHGLIRIDRDTTVATPTEKGLTEYRAISTASTE